MKRLRWVGDGDVWEMDMSTPVTLDGVALPVPSDPLPLGLSRATRLAFPHQIDFFHRFMSTPFLPSFSPLHGLSFHRILSIPLPNSCFAALLAHFRPLKFASSLPRPASASEFFHAISRHLRDPSLYAFGFCSEFSSLDDTLLLSYDSPYGGDSKGTARARAVFKHEFPLYKLTAEAVWPGLFVDNHGGYWDVPFSASLDLASVPAEPGLSYHLCLRHNQGSPTKLDGDETSHPPPSLLPGLSLKSAFAYKHNLDIWRSNSQKLKMVQPFDAFLSNPHVSLSGIIGAAMTACLGDTSTRAQVQDAFQGFSGFSHHIPAIKSGFLADAFARISLTAQHGNFQRLFSDLTRFQVRLDFPSGVRLFAGATSLARDLLNSRQPDLEAVEAICPDAFFSLQQQIAGPFSFRVDSGFRIDLEDRKNPVRINDPVFAVEYALQVLGSAKAVAWYSTKHKEFMVELRFYEV